MRPDEVYNLAAQSHVQVSFDLAEYTADVDGTGTLRLLDAIRTCGLEKSVRFYQASTSEMYGRIRFQAATLISSTFVFQHAPTLFRQPDKITKKFMCLKFRNKIPRT